MDRCIQSWIFAFLGGALAFSSPLGSGVAAGQSVEGDGAVGPTSVQTGVAARPGRVRLVYELGPGARGCDDEAFFRRMLRSELEIPDPFEPSGPATHALLVRIERDSPGFRAIVRLRNAEGREVFARDYLERTCSDAVDRAVIVTMLVFPASDAPPPPPPAPPPPATAAPAPQETAEDEKISTLEARARAEERTIEALQARILALETARNNEREKGTQRMDIAWALAAGGLMTANVTPDVAPGIWLEGQGRVGPFSLGVELRGALPSNVPVYIYTFDQSEAIASLLPCFHYLYFFGCAKIGAGLQIAYDSDNHNNVPGYEIYSTAISSLYQTGARLGGEVFFGDTPVGAKAWAEMLFSWPHHDIYYKDPDGFHDWVRPDLSAYFGLGLVVKLGGDGAK
ncbi:MAG: hypothetical protein U0441_36840 [Polyangiaceae bacterium]